MEKVELVKNNKDGSFNTIQVKEHEKMAQNRHIWRLIVDRAMSLQTESVNDDDDDDDDPLPRQLELARIPNNTEETRE